jgi:hypothetical protein
MIDLAALRPASFVPRRDGRAIRCSDGRVMPSDIGNRSLRRFSVVLDPAGRL